MTSVLLRLAALGALTAMLPQQIARTTPRPITKACSEQVTYLSDTDPGYRFLEKRQKEIYERFPHLADPFSKAELNKPRFATTWTAVGEKLASQGCDEHGKNCVGDTRLFKQLLEQLRCSPLPTRFESPAFILLINLYKSELEIIQHRDYPKAQVARFGSLPSRIVDGEAMMAPDSNRAVVILNRDLFFFTGAFSKALSDAIDIQPEAGMISLGFGEKAIAARLAEHPYIVRNFASALSHLILNRTSRGAEEVTLDADHNRLHARLLGALDAFLIAHEQAHVVREHVSRDVKPFRFGAFSLPESKPVMAQPAAEITIPVQVRTRAQELEADAVGFQLMVETLRVGATPDRRDPLALMIGAAAPHIAFRIMEAADMYQQAAGGPALNDGNHPPAADRVKSLAPVYEKLAGKGGPLDGLPDFREVFDASLEALLKAADPLVREDLGLRTTR